MDATEAGEGNLEILVRSHSGRGPSVPTRVAPLEEEAEGEAVFRVDFDPRHASDHLVQVTFNDENVPGNNKNNNINNNANKSVINTVSFVNNGLMS